MAEEKKVKIIRTTLDDLPMGREEDLPEPGSKLEKYELPEGVNSGMLYRDVLRIAWPSLVELILTQFTSMADQIMVGRLPGQLGVQALSAVGLSTQPKFLLMTLVQSLNIGGTAMVARYRGLGDQKKANQVLRQSVIVNLVLAIFFAIMGVVFARPMVKLIAGANISETTLNYGITYFKIQMYGFVPIGMTFTLTAALRGCGDTKMPMIYNTIANIVNVVFNYLLIYGKFGFPEMDVAGASLATVIGQTVAFLIAFAVIVSKTRFVYLDFKEKFYIDSDIFKDVVKIGFPSMMEQLFMRAGIILYTRTITSLGDIAYATHQICMNIQSMSFMMGMAFQNANTTLSGQSIGKKRIDMAWLYNKHTKRLGLITAVILAALIFTFSGTLVRLYNENPEVIRLGSEILAFVAFMQPFQNQQFITNGALRGAGDTRFSAMVIFVTVLGIRSGFGMLFVHVFHWGLKGAWYALVLDQGIRTALILWHYSTGKWRFIKMHDSSVKSAKQGG